MIQWANIGPEFDWHIVLTENARPGIQLKLSIYQGTVYKRIK